MSEIIDKNPEWLIEQMEAGIQGYLEEESERIIASIKSYILGQIRDMMYLEHSESDSEGDATVRISFEIPDPAECARAVAPKGPAGDASL